MEVSTPFIRRDPLRRCVGRRWLARQLTSTTEPPNARDHPMSVVGSIRGCQTSSLTSTTMDIELHSEKTYESSRDGDWWLPLSWRDHLDKGSFSAKNDIKTTTRPAIQTCTVATAETFQVPSSNLSARLGRALHYIGSFQPKRSKLSISMV